MNELMNDLDVITVSNLKMLNALRIKEEGDIVFVQDSGDCYGWHNGEWVPVYMDFVEPKEESEKITGTTLYDINRQAISQMPDLKIEDILKGLDVIQEFIDEKEDKYFMLLNNERKYYTMFVRGQETGEFLPEVLLECFIAMQARIKSIQKDEDNGAIEIWAQIDDSCHVFYLFGYDVGVVECE